MDDVARVVLALEEPDVAEEVLQFLDRSGRARVVATASDDRQLAEAVRQCEPDAVVAAPGLAALGPLLTAPLLALATRESVAALRAAVHAGAKGFYVWPGEREGLLEGVADCGAAARRVPERQATVVAVHAARGGAGCTFLATHLARSFERRGRSCVLVDADLTFGDVAAALGATSDEVRSVADLAPVADELSWGHVADVLVGGAVLAPPSGRIGEADEALVRAVVHVAASAADVVVVHLPRALDPLARWCLAEADRIVEVLTLDVFAFRGAHRAREALADLALADRTAYVVNRAARSELVVGDVRRAFGVDPVAVVALDAAVPRAQDHGRLLAPRGRTARAVDRLAGRLLEASPGAVAS